MNVFVRSQTGEYVNISFARSVIELDAYEHCSFRSVLLRVVLKREIVDRVPLFQAK